MVRYRHGQRRLGIGKGAEADVDRSVSPEQSCWGNNAAGGTGEFRHPEVSNYRPVLRTRTMRAIARENWIGTRWWRSRRLRDYLRAPAGSDQLRVAASGRACAAVAPAPATRRSHHPLPEKIGSAAATR